MTKSYFLFPVLWNLGITACAVDSQEDADAQIEPSQAESAIAGVLPPQRCERLQVKLTARGSSSSTAISVPGPYKASLSSDGKKMSCTGPTGDFIATSFLEDFFASFVVRFALNSNNTAIAFRDPLEPQQTTVRWQGVALGPTKRDWTAPIAGISCIPYTAVISAPGFADQSISVVAELNGVPGQSGTVFRTGCRYRVKGPVTITRDRPADVTGTNGDGFVYATPPVFCDGDDCQPPACPPANQCSVASDCGSPARFTCTNGCCLTIIR